MLLFKLQQSAIEGNGIKESAALLNFANNIRETFVDKRCKSILAQARQLMKKELHHSVLIEEKPQLTEQQVEEFMTNTKNIEIDVNAEEELLPLPQGKIWNSRASAKP